MQDDGEIRRRRTKPKAQNADRVGLGYSPDDDENSSDNDGKAIDVLDF